MPKKNKEKLLTDAEIDKPSRSQLKRESTALQKLGEELCKLSPNVRQTMNLPPELYAALEEYKKIPSFEGKRRHLQYIGKLMREEDSEQIIQKLEMYKQESSLIADEFHEIEKIREKLMQDDLNIYQALSSNKNININELRHLVKNAQAEQSQNKHPKAYRDLFKYLRKTI